MRPNDSDLVPVPAGEKVPDRNACLAGSQRDKNIRESIIRRVTESNLSGGSV